MRTDGSAARCLSLDDALGEILIESTVKVFSMTFGIDVTSQGHQIVPNFQGKGDVSGSVGMVQDRIEASLTVSFPESTILGIINLVYDPAVTEINMSTKQAVGELTNVIYGVIKQALNERGYQFKMAIPSVIVGKSHSIQPISKSSTLVAPFETPYGPFSAYLVLQGQP